jgi:hypothetical protein
MGKMGARSNLRDNPAIGAMVVDLREHHIRMNLTLAIDNRSRRFIATGLNPQHQKVFALYC